MKKYSFKEKSLNQARQRDTALKFKNGVSQIRKGCFYRFGLLLGPIEFLPLLPIPKKISALLPFSTPSLIFFLSCFVKLQKEGNVSNIFSLSVSLSVCSSISQSISLQNTKQHYFSLFSGIRHLTTRVDLCLTNLSFKSKIKTFYRQK